jgi:hypothetical protein
VLIICCTIEPDLRPPSGQQQALLSCPAVIYNMLALQQQRLGAHRQLYANDSARHSGCRVLVLTAAQQQQQHSSRSCSRSSREQRLGYASTSVGNISGLPLACAFTVLQLLDASAAVHPAAAAVTQQQQEFAGQQLSRSLHLLQLLPAPQLISLDESTSPPLAAAAAAAAATAADDLLSNSSGPGGLPAVYSQLPPLPTSFPELPKLQQPKIYQEVLPNGLRVSLLEDREVPLIRGSLLMPGGQVR